MPYLTVGMSAVAVFAVFLFLTYNLQLVKGFSPIITGVSFLPLTAGIVTASTSASIVLLPRTGPRPLVATGMSSGAIDMFLLARLTPGSGYAATPALFVGGAGRGSAVSVMAVTSSVSVGSSSRRVSGRPS